MSELKFASANEALQHLANITGKRVKVRLAQDVSGLKKISGELEKIVQKWYDDGLDLRNDAQETQEHKQVFGGRFHGIDADDVDLDKKFFPNIKGAAVEITLDWGSADPDKAIAELQKRTPGFPMVVTEYYAGAGPYVTFFKSSNDAKYYADRLKELFGKDEEYMDSSSVSLADGGGDFSGKAVRL
jgi:hypothetical protein